MTREDIEKKMHEAAEEIKPLITTLVEALYEAHQKGYLAGVELGAKMAYPHWIPVEERLPEENQRVWIFTADGKAGIARYDKEGFNVSALLLQVNVTHWMPIVPPRKEEQ